MTKRNATETLSAIVYARTSGGDDREDKVEGTSKISDLVQLEQGNKLANAKGYSIILEAKDVHRSSRTYPSNVPKEWLEKDRAFTEYYEKHIKQPKRQTRDGLARVMEALPKADRLIVRDITRLARPFKDSYLLNYLFQELRENNVTIETTTGMIIEPTDNMAKMVAGMVLSIEDDSLQTKNEGHRLSLENKRNNGNLYMALKFLGYRTENRKVRVIPSEARIVRMIFDMFLEDRGIGQIVRHLNDTIKAKTTTGTKFSPRGIKVILSNIFYSGYQFNSDNEPIKASYLEGLEIVSLEDWKLAKAKLNENKRHTSIKKDVHPLSGLLYCGYCGSRLCIKAGTDSSNWFYGCYDTRNTGNPNLGCKLANIREEIPIPFLRKASEIAPSGLLQALRPLLASQILSHLRTANGTMEYRKERDAITVELESIREKEEGVNSMLLSNSIGMDQFRSLTAKLKADRDKLQERQAMLSREVEEQELTSSIEWSKLMAVGASPIVERRMFNATIERVEVYAYHIKIELKDGSTLVLERYLKRNKRALPQVAWHYNADRMPKPYILYTYDSKAKARTEIETDSYEIRIAGYAKKPTEAKALLDNPQTFKEVYNAPLSEDDSRRMI